MSFETILWILYYATAFFYIVCGVIVLAYPSKIEQRLPKLFPVLIAFNYRQLANSLNLICVGAALLIIGKYIALLQFKGFFLALMLSALEVYLGFSFYYYETRDMFQAVVHVVLHSLLVVLIGGYMVTHMNSDITHINDLAANIIDTL